jgi:hypothetical protein
MLVLVAAAGSGIYLLALLACPISMGLMMWFMGRGMMGGKRDSKSANSGGPSLEELKVEQARLAKKIAELDDDPASAWPADDAADKEPARASA